MTEFHQFIADCETLMAMFGRADPASGAVAFDSPGLVITKGGGDELEIKIKYFLEGRVMTNPVIMRNKEGVIFRAHGEWRYAEQRVKDLLAGSAPNEPIRLK